MTTRQEIAKKLDSMTEQDIYSLMLFSLFKLKDVPEYSSMSELAYVLDGENLLNLLTYFGGTTIKIPTVTELRMVLNVLLLYQYTTVDGMDYDSAMKQIDFKGASSEDIRNCYTKLSSILSKYDFGAH